MLWEKSREAVGVISQQSERWGFQCRSANSKSCLCEFYVLYSVMQELIFLLLMHASASW